MALSPSSKYILQAFIPYTKANMQLAFRPGRFFTELEKKSKLKKPTLQSAYYRAIKAGLVELDDDAVPRLTQKGLHSIRRYNPLKLGSHAQLLVVFDIPEDERHKRDHLRRLLRELSFKKVQQSIWASEYDHREYLAAEIKEYELEHYVVVYEAIKLSLE